MASSSPYAGIYPPIATPFDEAGEVSVEGLRANLDRWNKSGLRGMVILGSNGEFPYLDDYERDTVVATVVEHAREDLALIVGTGRESTRATIRTTQRAAELGADVAIVVHPSYYTGRMTDDVLYAHYAAVASESPVPVMLYNVPPFTGVNMSAALVTRLAQVPNIVGVKDTSANIVQIAEIVSRTPPEFATLAGSASFLLASLAVGAQGGILALANVAPDVCVQMYRDFQAGDLAAAQAMQHRILGTNAAITGRFGAAGLKWAMELRGFYGGLPRLPLLPLSAPQKLEIEGILKQANLL